MRKHEKHLKVASGIAKLLDSQFKIGRWSFGLDPILGLIPGVGDTVSLLLSGYIVWIGIIMGLPFSKIVHMIINVVFDSALGIIPVLGDLTDFVFKANEKNLKILNEYASEHPLEAEEAEVIA